jgi:dipeptidyl aminopeptidase/acylaminoacyl peptidase
MTDTPPRPVTAQDLLALRIPGAAAVDPEGRRVVLTVAESDFDKGEIRTQLHLAPDPAAPPDEPRATRALTFGLDDATHPAWSPDGRALAFVTFRPQPHEEEEDDRREDGTDKKQVFLLPADGGEARRLTEAAEGVEQFRWLPDGSGVIFAGHAPRPAAERGWRRRRRDHRDDPIVLHADVPESEIWIHPLDGAPRRVLSGVKGLDDFDLSPDGKWLAYSANFTGLPDDAERLAVVLRHLESGEERRVTRGRGGAESMPTFSLDGRFLLFHGWADPALLYSRQELFAIDLAQPEAPPRPLLAGLDRDLEEFVALPGGRALVALAWGMESRLAVVDPASGDARVVPLEGFTITGIDAAAASGRVAAIVEGAAQPPEAAWIDLETGALELLTDLNPQAAGWERARRMRVAWRNDGFAHEGLLVLPPQPAPEPPPVLVWIHGGPHWRAIDTYRVYEAEAFAADGWAVFMPQYRGSSGYGEAYALALRGDLAGGDVRDILAGLDQVAAEGLVDATRAAVGGASYGAYLTNWLIATTARFRAGVSVAGIFDLAQDYSTSEYANWEVHYLGGRPWERPELYRERSPLAHAAGISAPILIVHGSEDDTTLVTNGRALYRAMQSLGKTVEMVVYPREGHGIFEPAHRLDAHQRTVGWLDQHVRGRAPRHVAGRRVAVEGIELLPLAHATRKDYAGVRPPVGRAFLEVALLLRDTRPGGDALRLGAAGPGADGVLLDEAGTLFRPIGVPLEVHGQPVLLRGRGAVESWPGEDGRPAALPLAAVFEVPAGPGLYRLQVAGLPPVLLELAPEEEDDEDEPGEGEGASERAGEPGPEEEAAR